jgi:hypothetical protein
VHGKPPHEIIPQAQEFTAEDYIIEKMVVTVSHRTSSAHP